MELGIAYGNGKRCYAFKTDTRSIELGLDINPMIEEERIRFTTDGLHFNDEGHARLASLLEAFLLSLPE